LDKTHLVPRQHVARFAAIRQSAGMRLRVSTPAVAAILAAAAALHCGSSTVRPTDEFPTSAQDAATAQESGPPQTFPDASTSFTDFPAAPAIDSSLPPDIDKQFAGAGAAPGPGAEPCISEPANDAMIPKNWTPLFVEWAAAAAQTVTEVRLTVDNQANPYVAYVPGRAFTLPAALWSAVAFHSAGRDVNIALRTAELKDGKLTAAPSPTARSVVHVAPVDAPGSVVYWSSSPTTSFQGFTIGDTASKTVLTPQTAGTSAGGQTECVSCHTSSIDGKLIFYTRDIAGGARAVDVRKVASPTPPDVGDVSAAAVALLARPNQYAPQLSAAHYSATDAVAVTVFRIGATNELIWTDLHATDANGWGRLARNGDTRHVSSPAFRHDGSALAYTSSAAGGEGVIADVTPADQTMDIYTVQYGNRLGGNAAPLPGASDPQLREFYPTYSPSDTLLAFNRTAAAVSSYNQPSAEVAVVPGGGGTATRLRANDPPACTGKKSPGLTNSWPRWAPKVGLAGDKRYYWLVFSSTRREATGVRPQLYISAIVTQGAGAAEAVVAEYPAVYVSSQDPAGNNHIPAWDVFELGSIPK